ncbi:hypothetical protein HYH02_011977 [Chlamydomonas schloesseri]|uniref:Nucleosome assembly protein n=1 Tax=Chlamydomonas schloesseri TaxID=2026947 RepID=A0A835SXK2_9CHLO|nr:hypothetical protein HYH02_011977 [Chlamydomonas schloesseri]|eukprot:KAG2434978.1 hypothetical protein HYH02_011977 [Chlamydomonas schloesseri]
MALAMLTRQALRAGSLCSRAAASRPAKVVVGRAPVAQRFLAVVGAAPKGKTPPPPPPQEPDLDDDLGEGDEEDYYDPMEELNTAQRRRVLAMKEVQRLYDGLQREYQAELAQLQSKYNAKYAPLYDERRELFSGKKAVTDKFDLEDDGEPDGPIPDFWLNALANHNKIGPFITERDSEVLKYLEDIRSEVLVGEERGFKLTFHFKADNPHFTNSVLEKVYLLEPEDDVVPKAFTGTVINWKEGRDVTVEEQKRRVKAPKGDKSKPAFVVEKVPCDSLFTIFDPPKVPTEADAANMSEEELEEVEDALSNDFEIGFAIKDQVIPRAVEWFTGEIAPLSPEDYDDEYEEGEY